MAPGATQRNLGRMVGGYEILAKLKSGGMATLYLGRRPGAAGFSRLVAIKFVHEHLAEDEDFVRMFVNEALLQARISHPNVVHVEELGESEGQHFLVMEYVHGCSLSQFLRALGSKGRALSPELAVYIATQVAAGLHAAHEARDERGLPLGVVHRDVSPDNVLVAYEGHVKLIDFGVAKVESRVNKTSTGTLKGKLRYMSPEQASGAEIDRRTDVYALAIVLWELLTMRRLFPETDQLLLLDAVRNPVIPAPSSLRAGLSPQLEAVVMKGLARDPAARYATTHDFRRALAEALPSAMLTDASQLAALLSVTMAEEMAKDQARLPAAVSAVIAPPRPSLPGELESTLATLTITLDGHGGLGPGASVRSLEASAPASQPSASGARPVLAPTAISSPAPLAAAAWPAAPFPGVPDAVSPGRTSLDASQPALPAMALSSPDLAIPHDEPASAASPLRWVVLAGAAVGLLAALGLGAFFLTRTDGAGEQIRVTPLGPTAASPSPPTTQASPAQPTTAQPTTAQPTTTQPTTVQPTSTQPAPTQPGPEPLAERDRPEPRGHDERDTTRPTAGTRGSQARPSTPRDPGTIERPARPARPARPLTTEF